MTAVEPLSQEELRSIDQLGRLRTLTSDLRVFGNSGIFAPTPELVAAAEVALAVEIAVNIISAFKGGSDDALDQINAKLDLVLHNQKIIIAKLDQLNTKLETILALMKDTPFDVKELAYFISIQALAKRVEDIALNVQNSEAPETASVEHLIQRFDTYCAESEVFIQQYSQSIPQIHAAFSLYASLRLFYAAAAKYKGPKLLPDKIWFRDQFKRLGKIFALIVEDSVPVPKMKEHFLSTLEKRRTEVEMALTKVPDIDRLMELYGSAFDVNIPDGKYLHVHNLSKQQYWESCGGKCPNPRTRDKETPAEDPAASRSTFRSCKCGYAFAEINRYFMLGLVKYDLGPFITDEYRFVPVTHSKDHQDWPLPGVTYTEYDFTAPQSAATVGFPIPPWPLYQKAVMNMRLYVMWLRATEFLRDQALSYQETLSS